MLIFHKKKVVCEQPLQLDESMRLPKETIDILKDQVFGFDTFFVTSQEPYEVRATEKLITITQDRL